MEHGKTKRVGIAEGYRVININAAEGAGMVVD